MIREGERSHPFPWLARRRGCRWGNAGASIPKLERDVGSATATWMEWPLCPISGPRRRPTFHFPIASTNVGGFEPFQVLALLPVPPLDARVSLPMFGSAVRNLSLSRDDNREVPGLAQVLTGSSDRACQVGDLIGTLANRYFCRSGEARWIGKERHSNFSSLHVAQHELVSICQSSSQQAGDLEHALFDLSRYRGELDALRAVRVTATAENRRRSDL